MSTNKIQKNKTVGIVGANWFNKGSETMIHTVIEKLSDEDRVRFIVFVTDKKFLSNIPFTNKNIEVRVESLSKTDLCKDVFLGMFFFVTRLKFLISRAPNLSNYASCDVVVDIHGYAFTKVNKKVPMMMMLKMLLFKSVHKDYYVFPQSIDYIDSYLIKVFSRIVFSSVHSIYVRGEESRRNLMQMIGNKKKIEVVPDIAISYTNLVTDKTFAEWKKTQSDNNVLLVSVNKRLENVASLENYKREISKVIVNFISDGTGSIVLLPHEGHGSDDSHDMKICREIMNTLPTERKKQVYLLENMSMSPAQYKYIISEVDYVIASRFHVCVASLSLGIPTMIIGWSFKYEELLGWYDQKEYILPAVDLDAKDVEEMFAKLRLSSDTIRADLVVAQNRNITFIDKLFADTRYDIH